MGEDLARELAGCPHCGPVAAEVEYTEISTWGSGEVLARHRTAVMCSVCDQPLMP